LTQPFETKLPDDRLDAIGARIQAFQTNPVSFTRLRRIEPRSGRRDVR
jgi:hypothetical protein